MRLFLQGIGQAGSLGQKDLRQLSENSTNQQPECPAQNVPFPGRMGGKNNSSRVAYTDTGCLPLREHSCPTGVPQGEPTCAPCAPCVSSEDGWEQPRDTGETYAPGTYVRLPPHCEAQY